MICMSACEFILCRTKGSSCSLWTSVFSCIREPEKHHYLFWGSGKLTVYTVYATWIAHYLHTYRNLSPFLMVLKALQPPTLSPTWTQHTKIFVALLQSHLHPVWVGYVAILSKSLPRSVLLTLLSTSQYLVWTNLEMGCYLIQWQ